MRAPLSWLSELAPITGEVADLAATLSGLGLVVDGVVQVGEGLDDVVVARVLATRVHPGADKVQLVDVDAGGPSPLQIVCGAFNFGAGDLVPLATVGATLPGGFEIGRRKVRGEWSEGMLCSAAELGLATDAAGIMVLEPGSGEPGSPLTDALGIVSDVVFDLDVTPNRPDALSIAGVARDLAAALGVPFALPDPPALPVGGPGVGLPASVEVQALDLCPRFTGTVLSDVSVGPSPSWLSRRLTLAGMRPISNLVDVSNYVMLELGQPNHAYDLDRLAGGGLQVRRGRPGEVVVTLDGVERVVGADDCLICDAEGGAVGIGGIMGGASSEISDSTTRVLLEAAWFSPVAIARTSKRLGLRSEASVRFERGVDPEGIDRAVARFAQLAGEVAGVSGTGPITDVRGEVPRPASVVVRVPRVNAILGTELTVDDVAAKLTPIGFTSDRALGSDSLTVAVPSWRPDCQREIDVIEEVARHHGYSNIARSLPVVVRTGGLTAYQRERRKVREILVGAGLSEAWATSFLAADDLARAGLPATAVEVENPLTAEESRLRPSLFPGLLRAMATNRSARRSDAALFEIGHVFLPPEPGDVLPKESENLAAILGGAGADEAVAVWSTLVDGLRRSLVVLEAGEVPGLHPTRTARVVSAGRYVGAVGEVDPDVVAAHGLEGRLGWFEVDLGALLDGPRNPSSYRPVSRFPSADVDLAFVVPDAVPAAAVQLTLAEAVRDNVECVELFDVFRGPQAGAGRRSLAFRARFSALDHTLTEDELAALRERCIEAVEQAHGANLRG